MVDPLHSNFTFPVVGCLSSILSHLLKRNAILNDMDIRRSDISYKSLVEARESVCDRKVPTHRPVQLEHPSSPVPLVRPTIRFILCGIDSDNDLSPGLVIQRTKIKGASSQNTYPETRTAQRNTTRVRATMFLSENFIASSEF